MSLLFPPGITHLMDLPFVMFNAIRNALGFLSFDELPSDERPPRSIWMEPKLLNDHFREVERVRKAKYGGGDDSSTDIKDVPIKGPVERNALINELLV